MEDIMENIRRRGNFDNYIEYAYLHLYLKKKKKILKIFTAKVCIISESLQFLRHLFTILFRVKKIYP